MNNIFSTRGNKSISSFLIFLKKDANWATFDLSDSLDRNVTSEPYLGFYLAYAINF